MHKPLLFALFATIMPLAHAANALTVTSSNSYIGDICDDFDSNGGATGTDFNDCNEIVQNGGPLGLFSLGLENLKSFATSAAHFDVSVRISDLFGVGGGNNPIENFALRLDNYALGTLFDASIHDEALINAGLAQSVQANIDASTASHGPINLAFSLTVGEITPLIADGRIDMFFDFSSDGGVNSMRDISISVNYSAVPLPAGGIPFVLALAAVGFCANRRNRAG